MLARLQFDVETGQHDDCETSALCLAYLAGDFAWVMSVLRHLLLVLGVSLAAGQDNRPPPPSPAPPPPSNTSESLCSQNWCTSPDPYGGNDCFAGSDVEACTCSRGTAKQTGVQTDYEV